MFSKKQPRHDRSHNTRRLAFESLEQRQVLAGNVTAALVGDVLDIDGDAVGNKITVVSDGANITVQGIRNTRINGAKAPVTFAVGAVASIDIDMEGGNDSVTVRAVNAAGIGFDLDNAAGDFFSIDMGDGRKQKVIVRAENSGGTGFATNGIEVISTGRKDRALVAARNSGGIGITTSGGDIDVDLGGGNNKGEIVANNTSGTGIDTTPGGNLVLNGTTGHDRFEVAARRNGTIDTNEVNVTTNDSQDRVNVRAKQQGTITTTGDININTGGGKDRVNVKAEDDGTIDTGANDVNIETEEGRDRVDVKAIDNGTVTGDDLNVDTGPQNDFLVLRTRQNGAVTFNAFNLDGGDGNRDRLRDRVFGGATTNFERFV